jgi:hypothetical protein
MRTGAACAGAAILALAAPAVAQRIVDRAGYVDRLRAMWLGECIANWTGLRTEGARQGPPFFTDADWDTTPPGGQLITFVTNQDPWWADDDTDVEYVDLHLMSGQVGGGVLLSPATLAAGWLLHMNPQYIWVSNRRAWDLMGRGVWPPATGMPAANELFAFIDAQLTTEFFGAICPGMPEEALRYADLPIRTVAFGHAVHASQFYCVLYSLATQVPTSLSGHDKAIWLVREARRWIPDTSKAADIADFVLADFLANPDMNDWERTRDRIYERYQRDATQHGFWYYAWTESSVNFACGVMCLLYGQCDFRRTVQIGTLSGWDSDNCTATMGGLLGLMLGYQGVRDAFPGMPISDRYWIGRTRLNLPDYLPQDPQADDTLTLMAERMMPLVDRAVVDAGGRVDTAASRWVLPAPVVGARVQWNPRVMEEARSANNRVRSHNGAVTCRASTPGAPTGLPWQVGSGDPAQFGNGYEFDTRGREDVFERRFFFTSQGGGGAPGAEQSLEIEYSEPVEVWAVRFMEGDHWPLKSGGGGWFDSASIDLEINGSWVAAGASLSEPLDSARPFQIIDFVLPSPVMATGIRIRGLAAGGFVTCSELDAMSRPRGVVRMDSGRIR